MFSADISQVQFWEDSRDQRNSRNSDLDYLFPTFTQPSPWLNRSTSGKPSLMEDFILIAEFSEQEGPRPVIVIPKDGGGDFDQNEFSVKILAVDHQSSIVEGSNMTEDAQVVMSDTEKNAHAFIHHIVLNDIQARGYVRPFCITYVTADSQKIMKCYEAISTQMKRVARMMKYGNRLVFMRDLEKYLEDLDYTKAHLLISQRSQTLSTSNDNEVLNSLNTIRQCMEEVKDIMSKIRNMLNDPELHEKFQAFERLLRNDRHTRSETSEDSNSLKDFPIHGRESDLETSGSYNDRLSLEFSLFGKSKDMKPKLLDVSTLKGKRRFDRSLRGLHELCSWGAREGLKKLRDIRENLMRDYSTVFIEDLDETVTLPESTLLSFGYDTIGANFLTCYNPQDAMFCKKKTCLSHHGNLQHSLGSLESFKSLPSSYHSLLDDDTLYSANSSMGDVPSHFSAYERQPSVTDSYDTRASSEDHEDCIFQHDNDIETSHEYSTSVIHASFMDTIKYEEIKTPTNFRATWSEADYDIIDKEKDLKCSVNGCSCNIPQNMNDPKLIKENQNKSTIGANENLSVHMNVSKESAVKTCDKRTDEVHKDNDIQTTSSEITNRNIQTKNVKGDSVQPHQPNQLPNAFKFKIERITETREMDSFAQIDECDNFNKLEPNQGHCDKVLNNNPEQLIELTLDICDGKTNELLVDNTSRDNEHFIKSTDEKSCTYDLAGNGLSNNLMTGSTSILCDNDELSVIKNHFDQLETSCDRKSKTINDSVDTLGNETNVNMVSAIEPDVNSSMPYDSNCYLSKTLTSSENSTYLENSKINDRDCGFSVNEEENTLKDKQKDSSKSGEIGNCNNDALDSDGICLETGSVQSETDSLDSDRPRLNSGNDWKPKLENVMDNGSHSTNFARRKEKLFLPFSKKFEADSTCVQCLYKVLHEYNNLHHVIYSLLAGRPVVIIGTRRFEGLVREMLYALTVFTPILPSQNSTSLMCQIKQLRISDIHSVQLRGVVRSDNKPVEKVIPLSVRRYITLVDLDKRVLHCHPYQGTLLGCINAIFTKKRSFKSERALYNFIQMCLMEISTKAFNFYHSITESDAETDFCGVSVPRKSAMLELSSEKYLNKNGLMNSDCRIIKNLSELVKIQQIEEEFKNKYLTDSAVYPFSVTYLPTQVFRL